MATQTPAVNKPPQHKEVEEFSDAERTAWLKDGTMPALETDSPKEDASAASTPDKAAGSGPAKKDKSAIKEEQDKNWRALETERDTLKAAREAAEKELDEWRTGKRKPEEKKADAPKLLEMPTRPKMKDFMLEGTLDSDKYEAALDEYETKKSAYTNEQVQLRTAAQQQEQSIKTWETELQAKYGDKAKDLNVKTTVDALAKTMQDAPAFFMFLNDSKNFTDLLYVLGGKEFKLDALLVEARDPKTVTSAIRKLRDIERDIEAALEAQAKDGSKKNDVAEKKDNLTKAGKPPSEAAGASSSPADDGSADAAWKRKDLSAAERGEMYRERKNKEERDKRRKKVN